MNLAAGLPMENVSGSKTSVYTGCFCTDFKHLCYKDGEQCSTTTALGVQPCLNANRVSWFFGLTGNSANIDTACSSSLVALDIGCKGLLAGDEDMVRLRANANSRIQAITSTWIGFKADTVTRASLPGPM